MTLKYSILKLRVNLKKTLSFAPKFSPDEEKIISLVKGLANNSQTTILLLPSKKLVAYKGDINILIEGKYVHVTDVDEYFSLEVSEVSASKIYNILISIVDSRIRQAEKRINNKKLLMLDRMVKNSN